MLRIPAIEKALPDDLRKSARDHPVIALALGAVVGFYLGRSHGREILSAGAALGISAGLTSARRALGVEPRGASRDR
ncbi:MAG TPA: hypothetical protein VFF17_01205 [Thermoanaerobaculia bacterium]|nr:hypothetical protein [Thermoanaerobaculia bacterium]